MKNEENLLIGVTQTQGELKDFQLIDVKKYQALRLTR